MVNRQLVLLLFFPLISSLAGAQASARRDTLSNQAVVEMVGAKLPKDLIMEKIRTSPARFDVTATGLVSLNNSKVPKDIIKLMMAAPEGSFPVRPAAAAEVIERVDPPPPLSSGSASRASSPPLPSTTQTRLHAAKSVIAELPTDPGIYVRSGSEPLVPLEPNAYVGGKTSNMLGSALTGGLSKAKMKAVISSPEASMRTSDPNVEFYFIFEKTNATLGGSGQGWASLSSPNEFTLLRLDKKDSRREVTTAAVGAFSSRSGTDDKAMVPFSFVRLRPGVYRVYARAPLDAGEYAFFPASMGGQGTAGSGGKLFDFGVDER